jgi:hypothetical protein
MKRLASGKEGDKNKYNAKLIRTAQNVIEAHFNPAEKQRNRRTGYRHKTREQDSYSWMNKLACKFIPLIPLKVRQCTPSGDRKANFVVNRHESTVEIGKENKHRSTEGAKGNSKLKIDIIIVYILEKMET